MSDEYDDDDAAYTEADLATAATLARLEAERAGVRTLLAFAAAEGLSAASVFKALSGTAAAPNDPPVDDDDDADADDVDTDLWVPAVHKAAAHAPKGGVSVQGKDYAGGEFIPADVMANATDEEKAAVEGKGGGESKPLYLQTKKDVLASAPDKPAPTEDNLANIASALRAAMQKAVGDPKDQCIACAYALKKFYPEAEAWSGTHKEDEHGAPHTLARLGDHFIDVTADQFNPRIEPEQVIPADEVLSGKGQYYGYRQDPKDFANSQQWDTQKDIERELGAALKDESEAVASWEHREAIKDAIAAGKLTTAQAKKLGHYKDHKQLVQKAFDLHHDATPAERLAAAVEVALAALEDGSDPAEALGRIQEHADGETVEKAWAAHLHPRDDGGRFVSKDAIQAAKSDPKKAKELKKRVTNPEQRKKLDAALADPEVIGTKRGLKRHENETKRAEKVANRAKAREIRIRLIDQDSRGEELNPDDLRALIPHLSEMSHPELSHTRELLARQGASFGGKRLRADRVAALVAWATGKAAPQPVEAESGNGAGGGEPAVEKPGFSMPPTDDPDTTRLTPEKAKMLAESKDRYGGLNRVYAIHGSHVVVAQVVRASADGETLTLRPALFTQDQQKRMAEAGDDSLYDYKIPTAYAYPARNSTRLKLQSLLDDIVQGATGVRPNREIAGVSVVRLPQDVAGPSILDNLAAKYAKPDTGTAAAQPAPTGTSAAPVKTRLQALAEKAHAQGTPNDDVNTEYATPRDQYLAFTRGVVPPTGTKPDSATVLDYLSKLPDHARERLDQHFRAGGKSLREIEQFHRQAAGQVSPEQVRAERAARADAGDAARAAMSGSGASVPALPDGFEFRPMPAGSDDTIGLFRVGGKNPIVSGDNHDRMLQSVQKIQGNNGATGFDALRERDAGKQAAKDRRAARGRAADLQEFQVGGKTLSRAEMAAEQEKHLSQPGGVDGRGHTLPKVGQTVTKLVDVAKNQMGTSGVPTIIGTLEREPDGLHVVRVTDVQNGSVRGLNVGDKMPYKGDFRLHHSEADPQYGGAAPTPTGTNADPKHVEQMDKAEAQSRARGRTGRAAAEDLVPHLALHTKNGRAAEVAEVERRLQAHGAERLHAAGETVPFDGRTMESQTGVSEGAPVRVTRHGWHMPGDALPLTQAQVEPVASGSGAAPAAGGGEGEPPKVPPVASGAGDAPKEPARLVGGSDKQIAYAQSVRQRHLDQIDERLAELSRDAEVGQGSNAEAVALGKLKNVLSGVSSAKFILDAGLNSGGKLTRIHDLVRGLLAPVKPNEIGAHAYVANMAKKHGVQAEHVLNSEQSTLLAAYGQYS